MTAPRKPATPRSSVRDHRPAQEAATGQPGPQESIVVVIPGKPLSVNRATRTVTRVTGTRRFSRVLKTQEAEDFLARAQLAARQAMRGRPLLTGDLVLTAIAYWPSHGADSDGHLKPTKDSLQGIVYENDRSVCQDHTRREVDPYHPRTVVAVSRYQPRAERATVLRVDEMDDGEGTP